MARNRNLPSRPWNQWRDRLILTLLLGAFLSSSCLAASLEEAAAAVRIRDFKKAAEIYLELAKSGDPEAQFDLGNLYRSGRGVKKDLKQALIWFSKAAEQGHVKAQYTTGTLYENGWGVKADIEQAKTWYAQAALAGHKLAIKKLELLATRSPLEDLNTNQTTELLNRAAACAPAFSSRRQDRDDPATAEGRSTRRRQG